MKFRIGKFAIVGGFLALFNFAVYTFLARVVWNTNELLWLDSIIAYCLATILAFIMHSKITWKERNVTKHGIAMFFLWNGITAIIITPLLTAFFALITPLYEFAHSISSAIHLPFDYNFVESTGVFCLTTAVTMIINYFFYDKIVFDDTYFQKIVKKIKQKFKKPTKTQLFSLLIYLLPVIFALTSVFLITTSGEDNFQGAGSLRNGAEINLAGDLVNAFNYNSRITDMYAWGIIDYYDYQYSFGIDTIFRLVDATMIIIVFYLATYLALARKPKLIIKDALVFCAIFATFIVTPFGRAFYHEFSMIHNYVPLALITLLFTIPYIKLATSLKSNEKSAKTKNDTKTSTSLPLSKHPVFASLTMLPLGVVFGMSATITPLAFLVAVVLFCLFRRKYLIKPPLWFYSGIIGTITGFLICWLAGSGIDHYTNPATAAEFDYLPLADILSHFDKLLKHEIYNFALTLIPLFIVAIFCFIFTKNRKTLFSKTHFTKLSPTTINLIFIFISFTIIHILGASLVKAPPRLLIPAYLAGLILVFRLFIPHIKWRLPLTLSVIIATASIVIIHIVLLIKYHSEMSVTLNNIKNSEETTICIPPRLTEPTRIKIIDLAQANMIVDWHVPEPIYNKGIINCE